MKYHTLVFDLDGTLSDTSPGVFEGVRQAMKAMKMNPVPEENLGKFIGPPLQISFHTVAGLEGNDVLEATEHFRTYYRAEGVYRNNLYPGMKETLRTLHERGIRLVIGTLKLESLARELIREKGLSSLFSAVIGSDPDGKRTKKDVILLGLKEIGVTDLKGVLMIGDSEYDAIGAEEAGVDFCAAKYGFGMTPEIIAKHPCAVEVDKPLDLLQKV